MSCVDCITLPPTASKARATRHVDSRALLFQFSSVLVGALLQCHLPPPSRLVHSSTRPLLDLSPLFACLSLVTFAYCVLCTPSASWPRLPPASSRSPLSHPRALCLCPTSLFSALLLYLKFIRGLSCDQSVLHALL